MSAGKRYCGGYLNGGQPVDCTGPGVYRAASTATRSAVAAAREGPAGRGDVAFAAVAAFFAGRVVEDFGVGFFAAAFLAAFLPTGFARFLMRRNLQEASGAVN